MHLTHLDSGVDTGVPPAPDIALSTATARAATRRMFICDPVCVLPFGHNPPAMRYFRSFFAPDFDAITCCVGLPFEPAAAAAQGFRRHFRYLYDDILPVETVADSDGDDEAEAAEPWPNDPASRISLQDYRALMTREAIGRHDVLFLPSADFHSIHGLIAALRERDVARAPTVLLRLIGVMEHASHVVLEPIKQVCQAIAAARRDGYRIQLAAETPIYAHHLAANFDLDIAILPYPLLAEAIPLPPRGPFVVASAGSARYDKGFLDLLPIVRAVRRLDDGLDIAFHIQNLTDRHCVHQQTYINQLYAAPGVVLLPAVLSHEAMHALYANCHAVLMPYEQAVYGMRGSAVLMEAIAYGRHGFARAGLGFSSQIAYYQNGDLCNTVAEFASAIVAAARLPPAMLQRRLTMARARYQHDTARAYRMWMEQCDD